MTGRRKEVFYSWQLTLKEWTVISRWAMMNTIRPFAPQKRYVLIVRRTRIMIVSRLAIANTESSATPYFSYCHDI
jgi:hypothetical protein